MTQERKTAGGDLTPDQKAAIAVLATEYKSYGGGGCLTVTAARKRYSLDGPRWTKVKPLLHAPDLLVQVADGVLGLDDALKASEEPDRLKRLERHPFSAAYGDIQDADALDGLKASIEKDGLGDPVIWVYQGKILDGHHRLTAAIAAGRGQGLQLRLFEGSDGDAWLFTIRQNVHRRHLATGTKAALAWQSTKAAAESQNFGIPPMTQEEAAKAFGVSAEYVRRFGVIMQELPKDADEVKSGQMTLNAAYAKVKPSAGNDESGSEVEDPTKPPPAPPTPPTPPRLETEGQGGDSSRNEPDAKQQLENARLCKDKYKLIALRFEARLIELSPDTRGEIEAIRKAVKEMPPDEVRQELDEVKRELERAD